MGTINTLWYIALYLLYAVPIIYGISDLSINFAADYFKGVATTNLCFLTCGNGNWRTKFVKQTYMKKLKVSNVNIDEVGKNQTVELKACLKHYFTPIGVLIDPKCTQFENIILQVSTEELFDTYHKWLIIEENTSNTSIKDIEASTRLENTDNFEKIHLSSVVILQSLNLSIDAEIAVATTKDFSTYNIYEVFNFGKIRKGKFVIQSMGDWNIRTGLNLTKIYKYYRRWDFQQMALKMIIVIQPIPKVFYPEMILGRIPGPGVSILQQTSAQILHELADVHNLKYNITVVDRWVGDYTKKHKNAVTNSLYFRESDVGPMLRLLPAHFDRYDILHPPVTYVDLRYFYKIPTKGIGKFENQFLRPLSFGSWWGVILISALCGLVLLLSAVVEERPISADFAVCSVLALICQQFFEEFEDLKRISSARKLTTLVTGLSCLMIYNYYTSSVVSWLLNGPPPTINSLWELLDSSLKPMFEDIGYTRSWLQLPDYYFNKKCTKAEDELKRRLIIMQKKGINIVANVNEGIDLVKKGGYVFHAELHAAYDKISQTFTKSELCELGSLASMEKTLLYSAVPKRSAFREFFIWGLSHISEKGIINIVQLRTWPQVVKCEGSSPQALALGGAAPAFIILAAGFVLAIFIMLIERLKWKFDTARANNRTIFKINK